MAERVEAFTVTAPAATLPAAPISQSISFRKGRVVGLEIVVPDGHSGKTGLRFLLAKTAMLPITKGAWIITNNEIVKWPLEGYLDTGAWSVEAYNEDINPHNWYVRLLIDETQIKSATGSLPGRSPAEQELAIEEGAPEEGGGSIPVEEGPGELSEQEQAELEEEQLLEEEEEEGVEEEAEEAEGEQEEQPPVAEEGFSPEPEPEPTAEPLPPELTEEEPVLVGGSPAGGASGGSGGASTAKSVPHLEALVKRQVKEIAKLQTKLKKQPHSRFAADWRHELKVGKSLLKKDRAELKKAKAAAKTQSKVSPKTSPATQLGGGSGGSGSASTSAKQHTETEKEKKDRIAKEQSERDAEEKLAKKRTEIARLQGEIGDLQGETVRLQGEIEGLQGHIDSLTANLQSHPKAALRGQWENERNGDRTNIEGKRAKIAQNQTNIDHKRGEVDFWNNW